MIIENCLLQPVFIFNRICILVNYDAFLFCQVLFGTADGQVIVMDCHGRMLAHVLLHESDGILSMSWNYPSFLVEDSSESDTDSDDYSPPQGHFASIFCSLNVCGLLFTEMVKLCDMLECRSIEKCSFHIEKLHIEG